MRKLILVAAVAAAATASMVVSPAAIADCVGGPDTAGAKVCVNESNDFGDGGLRYTWFEVTSPVLPLLEYPVGARLSSHESGGVESWTLSDNNGLAGVGQSRYSGTPYDGTNTYAQAGGVGVGQRYNDETCEASAFVVGNVDCGPARVPFLELPSLP